MTSSGTDRSPGDEWTEHYRGLTLHINQSRECWWQVYNGTDRLYVEDFPDRIVDELLEIKPLGGRIRVTERGDVITRLDEDDSAETAHEYAQVWLGNIELTGSLVPTEDPELSIELQPTDVSPGDLWPSVYDGARYSFTPNGGVWWHNSATRKRHPVTTEITESIKRELRIHKPEGGSFRVTPSKDVITLIESPPTETIRNQFGELPLVIRNIIKLRKDRADLEMLPIYVGSLGDTTLEVREPPSITDQLSEEEQESLESWAENLGGTSPTSQEAHSASSSSSDDESKKADQDTHSSATRPNANIDTDTESGPDFRDDPAEWIDIDPTEGQTDER